MKIIKVEDTREYEEIGDVWKPIPGSGNTRECDRCGKVHEVHYTVEDNGKQIIVGASCAKADDAETNMKFKSLASLAQTLKRNQAILSKIKIQQEKFDKAILQVNTMEVPELKQEEGVTATGKKRIKISCGDVAVWAHWGITQERKDCVVSFWKEKRLAELCDVRYRPYSDDLEVKIKRQQEKINSVLEVK